jgi:hypothetical protein
MMGLCFVLLTFYIFIICGAFSMLCLWGSMKKKPLAIVENAHGVSIENDQPNWICSITSFLNTDLVASGKFN